MYTAFSYNCAVSWPPEQFSQGNLCQGSLGTTTTSNPDSASSAGQLNLCWANPMPTNMHHRKKKSPSQYRQLLGSEFSFFFFLAAKLLTYCHQHHPCFPSIGCGVLTLYIACTVACLSPFHSEDLNFAPLSVSPVHCTVFWYCPKSFRLR